MNNLIDSIIHFRCIPKEETGIGYTLLCQYPKQDDALVQMALPFCFPEGETLFGKKENTHNEYYKQEIFTFILTDIDAIRKYVYCRRFINYIQPECICIIAKNPHDILFNQILDKIVQLRKISLVTLHEFLEDIVQQPEPAPYDLITNISHSHIPYEFVLEESLQQHRYNNIFELLKLFGPSFLVDIIGNMLIERKFVFLSNSIGKLSETILTLTSLLYPFTWQHVLIPILPIQMASYPTAPMPYLIGIKISLWEYIKGECMLGMDDTIVIDIDKGVQVEGPSYSPVLFSKNSNILRSQLSKILNDQKIMDISHKNNQIYDVFHLFFYTLFFKYFKCFKHEPTKEITYDFNGKLLMNAMENDDKSFFEIFEDSQLCYMFFNERAEQKSKQIDIESICPLAKKPKCDVQIMTYIDQIGHVNSMDPRLICKSCNKSIANNEPCSKKSDGLYHTKCLRCCCCGSNLEGQQIANCEKLKCMYCQKINQPEMNNEEIDSNIKKNMKKKDKKKQKK